MEVEIDVMNLIVIAVLKVKLISAYHMEEEIDVMNLIVIAVQ
jgi:hypothetical protein